VKIIRLLSHSRHGSLEIGTLSTVNLINHSVSCRNRQVAAEEIPVWTEMGKILELDRTGLNQISSVT